MYVRQKRKLVAVLLLMLFVLTACDDKNLEAVADGLDKTMAGLTAAQKVVIESNKPSTPGGPKFLSDESTIKIGEALIKINEAVIKGAETTEEIVKLDEPSRQQLTNILNPILKAVGDLLLDPALSGIQNEATRTAIRAAIVAVQTTLTNIQTTIALSREGK